MTLPIQPIYMTPHLQSKDAPCHIQVFKTNTNKHLCTIFSDRVITFRGVDIFPADLDTIITVRDNFMMIFSSLVKCYQPAPPTDLNEIHHNVENAQEDEDFNYEKDWIESHEENRYL